MSNRAREVCTSVQCLKATARYIYVVCIAKSDVCVRGLRTSRKDKEKINPTERKRIRQGKLLCGEILYF